MEEIELLEPDEPGLVRDSIFDWDEQSTSLSLSTQQTGDSIPCY